MVSELANTSAGQVYAWSHRLNTDCIENSMFEVYYNVIVCYLEREIYCCGLWKSGVGFNFCTSLYIKLGCWITERGILFLGHNNLVTSIDVVSDV